MRKFSILLSATVLACTVACVQEIDAPMQTGPEGQKVTISFTAEYPGMSPDTKVLLDENEKILKWEGDETATLIFGIDSTNNSNNPTIPSIAPGVFQGEITIPSGFTMEDLRGIVVPSGNGANFRGNHGTYKARIRSYIDNPQTSDGTPDMDQCPFFVPLTKADIDSVDVNTFKAGSVSLYSAADLARYKVYGRHSEMESGEILQSVSITANGILAGSYEYNISNGGFGTNGSSKTVTVNSSQGQTIADKTSENGVVLYQNLLIGGSRTVSTVTVRTDKAVYTKSVNKTFSQKNKSVLRVYQIGLDLSSGFTRESLITYSADNGQTWEHKIPETFTTLCVKTGTGVNLSDETLAGIKAAMAKQGQAVDLDLRQSTYESSVFPAVFGGTADDRCTVIKSIRFPHNVTEVAENAFAYCSSLESVDLTDITTINTKAFFWSGLKTLDVPKTTTRECLYDTGNLAQTRDGAVRYVRDMGFPDKRHHMMLACGIQLDILYKHHLLILFLEHGTPEDFCTILIHTMGQKLKSLRDPFRRLYEALTFCILTKKPEDFLIVSSDGNSCRFVISFFLVIRHFVQKLYLPDDSTY